MKILKKPDYIIFDTENPNTMEFDPSIKNSLKLLSATNLETDWVFISENFKPIKNVVHPIFLNFGSSYFYCIEV